MGFYKGLVVARYTPKSKARRFGKSWVVKIYYDKTRPESRYTFGLDILCWKKICDEIYGECSVALEDGDSDIVRTIYQ